MQIDVLMNATIDTEPKEEFALSIKIITSTFLNTA